jgi:hypothetical protein
MMMAAAASAQCKHTTTCKPHSSLMQYLHIFETGVPVDNVVCYPGTCWNYGLYCILSSSWDANAYKAVLMSALWCRDLLTLEAVKELDEQSEYFQDIPLPVRRGFLEKVKWANLDSK